MEGEVKECRQGGRAEEKIARGCKSSLVLFLLAVLGTNQAADKTSPVCLAN